MDRSSITILLGSFLTLSLSCAADAGPPRLDFTEVDRAMEDFVLEHDLEGATMVVVHRDRGIVHEAGYGAFAVDRVSLLASSSKILSVGVLMRLADQGLLDLDAPISTYLSDWGQYKTDITVAQLLSNSSGMVGLLDNPTYIPYVCQYLDTGSLESCSMSIYTANDAADRVPPDTQFRYGGGQWQLAGGIAEVVSGQSWAELIEQTYVEPCQLGVLGYTNHYSRAFLGGGGVDSALSYPTFFDGDIADLPLTQNPNIEGGAYTTAGDYGQILLMHLRGGQCAGGRVLSEQAVERMQRDRIGEVYGGSTALDPSLQGYGLGWWVDRNDPGARGRSPRNDPGVVADAGAYGATPWLDVERGYGVMIILEAQAILTGDLRSTIQPILEDIFDGI